MTEYIDIGMRVINTANAQSKLNRVRGTLGKLGTRVRGVGRRFGGLRTALSSTVGQMASAYLGAMGLMMALSKMTQYVRESIKSFRDFETRLAEVRTLFTELESSAVIGVEAGIVGLSKEYGMAVNDLTEGLYDIISAAVPARKALNLLTTSTRAAIAGISDVATSVDIMTSILNAYGMRAEQMTEVSDKLFMTIRRGKLRFDDLANAMGYIAPIAANLGVKLDEVLATLSTVTRQGLHADMATRGLALMMQNFADVTPQAAEAAKKYGVEIGAATLRVKGFQYIMNQLIDAADKYGQQIVPQIVRNMRSLRVAMALAGEEGAKGLEEDLNLLEEATGRTQKAMNDMLSTTQKWRDIIDQTGEEIDRFVGEKLSPLDILLKKLKVGWATVFTTGNIFEARDAVKTLNDSISETASTAMRRWVGVAPSGLPIEESAQQYIDAQEKIEKNTEAFEGLDLLKTMIPEVRAAGGTIGKEFKNVINKINRSLDEEYKIEIPTVDVAGLDERTAYIKQVQAFEQVMNDIDAQWERLNTVIETNTKTMKANVEGYNRLIGGALSAADAADKFAENMATSTQQITVLKDEISSLEAEYREKVISTFDRMAGMVIDFGADYTDITRELDNGTIVDVFQEQAGSIWDTVKANNDFSGSIEDLLQLLSKEEDKINDVSDATEKWNDILALNNLQLMKLRLKEMQSRHGLRRGGELKRQKLQISNQKQRIKLAKNEIETEGEKSEKAKDYQRVYDELMARWRLQADIEKGAYETDLTTFVDTIESKQNTLKTWQERYNTSQRQMVQSEIQAYKKMKNLWKEGIIPDKPTPPSITPEQPNVFGVPSVLRDMRRNLLGHQRGSFAVPYTGLHMLHRGEEVVPKGSERHGGTMKVEVAPITVNARVQSETDLRSFGSKVGEAIAAGFISGVDSEYSVG